MTRLNPNIVAALDPPIMAAAKWLEGRRFPAGRPLLNMAQAAPADPPPAAIREAMAAAAAGTEAHGYGPVLGDGPLRAALADRTRAIYGGDAVAADVAITAGCNQAFCAALAALAGPGDEVILPTPWYFNHKMWLDMAGVAAVPLPCGDGALPDVADARALVTPRTRAIVLVTPNNPTGAEYPAALMEAFYDLAAEADVALIVDETYRDYHSGTGAPHGLFLRDDWRDRLVHLYSFSKAYHLMGQRVGGLIAGPETIAAVEKFLDTVTICPSRIGQIGALAGLSGQAQFVAAERAEFLARRAALESEFARGVGDWRLRSCGAYFAWVEHPFDAPAAEIAPQLVADQSLLILPGSMFTPGGDPAGARAFRIAFANTGAAGIAEMAARLRTYLP